MTEPGKSRRNEDLYQRHHEIQNCLNVISMGTDALAQARNDDAQFADLYQTVRDSRIEAARLLDAFLAAACDASE